MIAPSRATPQRLCVLGWVCLSSPAHLALLLCKRRPDRQNAEGVAMKYDLNAYAEMGNITLEAPSVWLRALKIQRFITHRL